MVAYLDEDAVEQRAGRVSPRVVDLLVIVLLDVPA
jgi:hypothetical protein